jgi:CRP-like cAMP-binding protein
VRQDERGARGMVRPGEYFGEVAPALGVARTATVTAMTPCVIASCDQEAFEELVLPLLQDGGNDAA